MKKSLFIAGLITAVTMLSTPFMSSAETGITKNTIHIGMYGPITGPLSIGALPLYGAEAIYKNVNDTGGIYGRKIELSVEDAACDPNKGISAIKKLIYQNKVFLIHGGWCSGVLMAIKPQLAQHQTIPFMDLAAASAGISTPVSPNIFQPVATTVTVANTMLNFALSKPNAKRIAIVSSSDEWSKSSLTPLLADMEARHIKPVATVTLEVGSTDATSQSLKIRAAKPDVVIAILHVPEMTLYVRDAYKYGIRVPTITTQGVSIENMVHRVGNHDATKNLFVFYPLDSTLGNPKLKKWIDIYHKYYPDEPVETLSLFGMTGALAVVQAIKNAGPDLTGEKVIQELNKLKDFDPGIQSGPLTFTPEVHAGITNGKMIYWPVDHPVIVSSFPKAAN